jgi:hypothetical protein
MKGHVIDHVAGELQSLASILNVGLDTVVDGWAFLLITFEFEGEGLVSVGSVSEAENWAAVARLQAERLRVAGEPGVEILPADRSQFPGLVGKLRAMGDLIEHLLPPGWGFGLLLYAKQGDGRAWLCSAQRADMPARLEEFAANLIP